MTEDEYIAWKLDVTRNPYRILLMDLDYSDVTQTPQSQIDPTHNRTNAQATLNPIFNLHGNSYSNGNIEITFSQPTAQEGYSWEIWVDGDFVEYTAGGDFTHTPGHTNAVEIAIASVKADKTYSIPWIVTMTAVGTFTVSGSADDWANISGGSASNASGSGLGGGGGDVPTGSIYLASQAWRSDTYVEYDDWIVSNPEMEEGLEGFLGVGDVDAVNPTDVDWLAFRWRGFQCRWYYGDTSWTKSQFRQIASVMIGGCRLISPSVYRFDLMESGQYLKRTFLTSNNIFTLRAKSAINVLMQRAELPPVAYYNIGDARNWQIQHTFVPTDEVDETIKQITDSIGAYSRIGQSGQIEIFRPYTGQYDQVFVTRDDILGNDVRMVSVEPAYKTIVIEVSNGTEVSGATGAVTGAIGDELSLKTLLNNIADANALLAEMLTYHAFSHAVWEINVRDSDIFILGRSVSIEHDMLSANGIVSNIKRSPTSRYSTIEVTV